MNREGPRFDWLGAGIATVLRIGSLIAIGIVGLGYVAGLLSGFGDGQRPLVALLVGGGPTSIVGAGLLGLTLLPVAVLVAASIGFAQSGERGRMLTSMAVLVLLIASLAAAALVAQPG